MRRIIRIALAHFVQCAPFVSKMNDKNFVYPVLIDERFKSQPNQLGNRQASSYDFSGFYRLEGGGAPTQQLHCIFKTNRATV